LANNKTPVKRGNIELNQCDDRKKNKNGIKKGEGEWDDDEVTLDGATAKMMEFVDDPKEVQGDEGG
jgi:hypothetical protein